MTAKVISRTWLTSPNKKFFKKKWNNFENYNFSLVKTVLVLMFQKKGCISSLDKVEKEKTLEITTKTTEYLDGGMQQSREGTGYFL